MDDAPFSYARLNMLRWVQLLVNLGAAATHAFPITWSTFFYVPIHVVLGGWVFWYCGTRLREMVTQQTKLKLLRGQTRWDD